MRFEWDAKKALSNLNKHGVSFEEASSVFYDEFSRTVVDPFCLATELRFLTLGMAKTSRILLVVHLEEHDDLIRIVSARPATNAERVKYESYR